MAEGFLVSPEALRRMQQAIRRTEGDPVHPRDLRAPSAVVQTGDPVIVHVTSETPTDGRWPCTLQRYDGEDKSYADLVEAWAVPINDGDLLKVRRYTARRSWKLTSDDKSVFQVDADETHFLLGTTHTDTAPYHPPVSGDMIAGYVDGRWTRVPPNTAAEVRFLAELGDGVNAGFPYWTSTPPSFLYHNLLNGVIHPDTLAGTVVRGDLVVGNTTPKWSRLPCPTQTQATAILVNESGDPTWGNTTLLYHSDTLNAAVVRGDIIVGNATPLWARLAKGTSGYQLTVSSGGDVGWAQVNLLNGAAHGDTVVASAVKGALIKGNATPKWDRLDISATGGAQLTVVNSSGDPTGTGVDAAWKTVGLLSASHSDTTNNLPALGRLVVGDDDVPSLWNVLDLSGHNGWVLTEDDTNPLGVKWASVATGSITVKEIDGTPTATNISIIRFDQVTGFRVTDDTGGQASVYMQSASTTQIGVVDISTQTFAGLKTFTNLIAVGGAAPTGSNQIELLGAAGTTVAWIGGFLSGGTLPVFVISFPGTAAQAGLLFDGSALHCVLQFPGSTLSATYEVWDAAGTFVGVWNTTGGFPKDIKVAGGIVYAITYVTPAAFTQSYSTASHTLAAYTSDPEGSSYGGLDNLQGATPYAAVADLNSLRVAYENLRAFVESLAGVVNAMIDDDQANGYRA